MESGSKLGMDGLHVNALYCKGVEDNSYWWSKLIDFGRLSYMEFIKIGWYFMPIWFVGYLTSSQLVL